ncbi:hypothetical protein B0H63DRAFT_455622 [Podospora didyma]|uniref:FAD-binding PCMH-type domain-containing protein n=1 Tax=Podospora didyma TaxID=330526 RepID=A0AAE0N2Z7_9PEZI|nr:hypothetical protein B0H63DRAFT_455622 [Podospora didyma]
MLRQIHHILAFVCAVHAAAAREINFEALFGPHVSDDTEIASAGSDNFSSVLSHHWTLWKAPKFQGAIKPATEADVQKIVKLATKNNISFLATNNGHGTNTKYGITPVDLNINLRNLNSVAVDGKKNTVTIGGGTVLGEVTEKIYAAGKELPTGNAVCVGMVGLTIGGGVGVQTGTHGLTLDALLSVRLVTWTGDVITVSKKRNADLFWAIKGAGANFGIITEATYELYDHTNHGQVLYNRYTFPASANRSIFELMATYDGDNLPAPMSYIPQIRFNRETNLPEILLLIVYFGSKEQAQPHIDKVLALKPVAATLNYGPQPPMFEFLSVGLCSTDYRNHFHVGTKRTDPATYEEIFGDMVEFYKAHPGYNGVVILQRESTRYALSRPVHESVYPWRDIGTFALMLNRWDPTTVSDADLESIADTVMGKIQKTSGFKTRHVYINYDYGTETLAEIYGAKNLNRLSKLKGEWDPHNKFGRGNPIPLLGKVKASSYGRFVENGRADDLRK